MDDTSLTIQAAIELVAKTGRRVFPVGLDKKPRIKDWPRRASSDPAELKQMFGNSRISEVGIGIVTGKANDLVVLDIDTGSEKDGRVWLEGPGQALPLTACSNTPSGGKHFYFSYPSGCDVRNSASVIAPGVDIRAEGGYAVAPPSRNTKGKYEWVVSPINACGLIAPFPDWLSQKLARKRVDWTPRRYTFRPWDRVRRQLSDPIPQGARNSTLASRCGTLCKVHGATFDWVVRALHEINAYCCQPPLSPREVDGIARSIFRKEFGGL